LNLFLGLCQEESEKEYHPYDGWYNNRAHPEWGVVGQFNICLLISFPDL